MTRLRRHTAAILAAAAALVLVGSMAALAAGTNTPPRTAFVANAIVPADALAAGPAAGRLDAPIFTTPQGFLVEPAETGLSDYGPDLVVVLGGTAAIGDAVVAQIAAATGLTIEDIADTPATGIVRVAGADRFQTAQEIAALFSAYDPGFLPASSKAADADLLDGKDSSEFLQSGDPLDADTLDGNDSTDFLGAADKAADADLLDGNDAGDFVARDGSVAMSGSLQAPGVTYTAPRSYTYTVPYTAFNGECDMNIRQGGASCSAGTTGFIWAPVNLPDGAVITGTTANLYDNATGVTVRARLFAQDVDAFVSPAGALASVETTGDPGYVSLQDSVADHVVDNSAHQYYLGVDDEGGTWVGLTDLTIFSYQITYELNEAL